MARSGKNRSPRGWNPVEWFNSMMDYFEWMFHQFTAGTVSVFTSIASIVFPRRLVDSMRKKSSARAAQRALGTTDKTTIEKVEDAFSSASRGVGSVFSGIFRLFVPTKLIESTEKAVSTKTASAVSNISHGFGKFVERITPKWLSSLAGKVNDLFAPLTKFVTAWTRSRDFRKLAWSVPAMLFALPIIGSFVGNIVYSSEDRIRHYQSTLSTAIDERDAQKEQLCFEKLTQLGFERTEQAAYASAMSTIEDGDLEEGLADLQKIAPLEEAGFPLAHLYLATQVAEGKLKVDDPWKTFETHSKHAKSQSTGAYRSVRDTARRFLIEADLHYGRMEQATAEMKDLVKTYPSLHGGLMDRYLQTGQTGEAIRHAGYAVKYFDSIQPQESQGDEAVGDVTAKGDVNSGDDVNSDSDVNSPADRSANSVELTSKDYLHWAKAVPLIGRSAEVPNVIDAAIRAFPNDQPLKNSLTAQLIGLISQLPYSDVAMLPLIKRSQEFEPDHPTVIKKLFLGVSQNQRGAVACLATLELEGLAPGELLIRLGDDAVAKSNPELAVDFYERAVAVDPQQIHAWNNMAYVLSELEPRNYELALKAINKAIGIDPKDSRLFETRGQIFVGLKRWKEAIADLEKGLNGALANPIPTHASLAKAYEAIGNKELAAAHRRYGRGTP